MMIGKEESRLNLRKREREGAFGADKCDCARLGGAGRRCWLWPLWVCGTSGPVLMF